MCNIYTKKNKTTEQKSDEDDRHITVKPTDNNMNFYFNSLH